MELTSINRNSAIDVQVTVCVQEGNQISVDPWDNCPSEEAKEEGRYCNQCEFWGQEVRGVDWSEFSLCLFRDERRNR